MMTKTTQRSLMKALLCSALVLLQTTSAYAAGGGHGTIADTLWPWVNFTLYLFILGALLKKPFAQAWKTRREMIEQDVNSGAKELQAAEQLLRNAQSRLAALEAQGKQLGESINQDSRRESAQIIDEAQRRSEFLLQQANETIDAEKRQAEGLVRKEIARKVLERTTELLKQEITPDVDRDLRRGVLGGVRHLAQ
jgi:F0F1-type ATP synthase membrane subunit b/b'